MLPWKLRSCGDAHLYNWQPYHNLSHHHTHPYAKISRMFICTMMIDAIHFNGRCSWWGRLSNPLIHSRFESAPCLSLEGSSSKPMKDLEATISTHANALPQPHSILGEVQWSTPMMWACKIFEGLLCRRLHHREQMRSYIAGSQ
jgi:hypothetical protein